MTAEREMELMKMGRISRVGGDVTEGKGKKCERIMRYQVPAVNVFILHHKLTKNSKIKVDTREESSSCYLPQ